MASTARVVLAFIAMSGSTGCEAQPVPAAPVPAPYVEAGERALSWTRKFVALGPRPAGSEALHSESRMIVERLGELSCSLEEDQFVAATPVGAHSLRNIIARFGDPAASSIVVVSGHYDTLLREGFVGANDGGSSAGFLMALAERLDGTDKAVWVVFLDGEEATARWSGTDHTYGSRHLAARWAADGTAGRISGLVNVDMIGDADLSLLYEANSNAELRDRVWSVAERLGYARHFPRRLGYIEDDHISFAEVGIPSIDLIDFHYGPGNRYWHTSDDTIDKLSASSFGIVLHVVERTIDEMAGAR